MLSVMKIPWILMMVMKLGLKKSWKRETLITPEFHLIEWKEYQGWTNILEVHTIILLHGIFKMVEDKRWNWLKLSKIWIKFKNCCTMDMRYFGQLWNLTEKWNIFYFIVPLLFQEYLKKALSFGTCRESISFHQTFYNYWLDWIVDQ